MYIFDSDHLSILLWGKGQEFENLRQQRVRVWAMDLRIASICIANQMTLLTRNTVDFERVPKLSFADWTLSAKH